MDLSRFKITVPVEVRFADIDALQHVNNARYFSYMESARIHYRREVLNWRSYDWTSFKIILAHVSCDFLAPVKYPNVVTVHIRASRLGMKSFDFEYAFTAADGSLVATGKSVQVIFDYDANQSISLPDDWRERMAQFDEIAR